MPETAENSTGVAAPPEDDAPTAPDQPLYEEPEDEEPEDLVDDDEGEDDEPPGPRDEDDPEEVLEPKVNPVPRVLRDDKGQERTYIQAPFEHFQMLEFYGLLAQATKIVLEGESGLGMDDIFEMLQPQKLMDQMMQRVPGYEDAPDRTENEIDLDQAAKILAAFARVVSASPQLVREVYLVALKVPKAHRNWAMEWALPNVSNEMGEDILETLIDQNWGVIERFFFRVLPRLARRAAKARERHASSGGRSKRTRSTAPTTARP